jgi:hypothetical protein
MRKEILARAMIPVSAPVLNAESTQNRVSTNCEPEKRTVELVVAAPRVSAPVGS